MRKERRATTMHTHTKKSPLKSIPLAIKSVVTNTHTNPILNFFTILSLCGCGLSAVITSALNFSYSNSLPSALARSKKEKIRKRGRGKGRERGRGWGRREREGGKGRKGEPFDWTKTRQGRGSSPPVTICLRASNFPS